MFINSRTAIAGAIIGLLLVFFTIQELDCIGALSFFFIFVRCFHTCFHDFELSKRDKQVKLSEQQVSLEAHI